MKPQKSNPLWSPADLGDLGEDMSGDQVFSLAILMITGGIICYILLLTFYWTLGPITQVRLRIWEKQRLDQIKTEKKKQELDEVIVEQKVR